MATWTSQAHAFDIDTGTDLKLRWDTNIKFTGIARVQGRSADLTADINSDDGDRNFSPGLISTRLDIFSEFDITHKHVGARLSGSGWFDLIYNIPNDNNSPATVNSYTVPFDHFTHATRNLHGRKVQLLDAFVFVRDVAGIPASIRAGRHALLWGESLLIPDNGISYAQAPLDVIKGLTIPGTEAKELFLPVWQIWGQVRPVKGLSVDVFYQFEWRRTRLPAAGSFSASPTFSTKVVNVSSWAPGARLSFEATT